MGADSMAASCSSAETARLPPGAYYALTILTALNVINVWHRYLIYNLSAVSVEDCAVCDDVSFEPLCFIDEVTGTDEEECLECRDSYHTEFYNLKDGACIDNTQYGVLAGVGFTIMFAVATLFAGRLTDTLDRRLLHTGAILVWSVAAAGHGTCTSFTCLLISRIFLGIGEAFNAPACYALITLYFPHARRATANGIYSTGTYLGSALSSLCLALAVLLGWRNTAFLSGAFGVLMGAVLFFTVEHNPVMPASVPGYTRLPDMDPDTTETSPTTTNTTTASPPSSTVALTGMAARYHSVGTADPADLALKGERSVASVYTAPPAPLSPPPGGALGSAGVGDSGSGLEDSGRRSGRSLSPPGFVVVDESPINNGGGSYSYGGGGGGGGIGTGVGVGGRVGGKSKSKRRRAPSEGSSNLLASYGNPFVASEGSASAAAPLVREVVSEAVEVSPRFVDEEADRGAGRRGARKSGRWKSGSLGRDRDFGSDAFDGAAGSGWGWYEDNPAGAVGDDEHDGGRVGHGTGAAGGDGGGAAGGGVVVKKHDLGQALRTIASNRVVLVLFAASSARMVATWSMASYLAVYYHRAFPDLVSMYSVINAVFVSVGGMASSYGGGAISDRLRIYNEGVLGYLPALGSAAAIVPMAIVLFSRSFAISLAALFVAYLVGECWLGPGMAMLQVELPKEIAGTSVAILLFLNSVVCNVGPWFVAWQDTGLATVRRPLFATLFVSYICSFCLFSAVGFMVSQKQKRKLQMLATLDTAGVLENGNGDAGRGDKKSVNQYTRQALGTSGIGGAGRSQDRGSGGGGPRSSMCEMVRKTFARTVSAMPEGSDDGDSDDEFGGKHGSTRPLVRGRARSRDGAGADAGRRRAVSGGAAVKPWRSNGGGNGEREALI